MFRNEPLHLWSIGFDKGFKAIPWGKGNIFNKSYWKNWIFIASKKNLYFHIKSCAKIGSKWIIQRTVRAKLTTLLNRKLREIIVTLV